MIDLHTHTYLSDGALCPAELIRRAQVTGYRLIAITDHVDGATVGDIVPKLLEAARLENSLGLLDVVAGVELTHVRPQHIEQVANKARDLGAQLVLCHGETLAEPVMAGTNRAAIEAGVDILAHPGLISDDDARRAAVKGVALEVTAKPGHCYTNGHVVSMARRHEDLRLVFGTDGHVPGHLVTREQAEKICLGAGMTAEEITAMFEGARHLGLAKSQQSNMEDGNY